ncbi:MAG: ATP-binding protein [Anaerolinea sp.]|nr:ATP-binding protein [Anaerolinea sp.]MCC6973601.1 ATP-binding protein [Anaerolineae bacterium]CAG0967474.1 serine/threonine-protein kinase RsbW [Anaerolineae bacterium]
MIPDSELENKGRVEIFLPSTLGYEKVARNAAAAVAEEMGFSTDRIEDLKTAVAEACMNAIEHGNREDKTTSVTVLLTAAPNRLEVNVTDEGLTPMPDEFPKPGRTEEHNRGWGMFFITQLMDKVEISRLPVGGNQVRMTIYLQPEAESGQGETKGE